MAATSSSVAVRGIHILDPEEKRMKAPTPWSSLGVDGEEEEEDAAAAAAMAMATQARGCDVYVGHGGDARRMAAWLRAELEMLGVPCAASDRLRCGDAPAHEAARAAMGAAAVGVVLVTPPALSNPYAVEEVRAFAARGALVPVFVGVRRRDFAAAGDVVERRGELWESHGGSLWMAYGGAEEEWRDAVETLARAEPAVEVRAGDLRDRVLDVVEIVGVRLGRPAVASAVAAWRAAGAELEIPLPWNAGFVGREKELLDLESMLLRGGGGDRAGHGKATGKRPMYPDGGAVSEGTFLDGVVCISGAPGAGKTELAVAFAHRHCHEYKKVLWVHGEARYLRQSYLKLSDHLGIAVGDNLQPRAATRSLHDIEGDAIAKIRKELTRDIPYLVIIDNLESDKDWWDGRHVGELLPRGGGGCRRTRVLVTTRLAGGLPGVRTLELGNLEASSSMRLMKGAARTFGEDDTCILRDIAEAVGGVALGLGLVGGILSEVAVGPGELRAAMRRAPHRAPAWGAKAGDAAALRDNPGMTRLLDAALALVGREEEVAAGLGAAAERLLEASSFFAPAPIPSAVLVDAAVAARADAETTMWKRLKRRARLLPCASPPPPAFAGGGVEQEALATLLRLGVARQSTREGFVAVHGVFRLFGRRAGGSGRTGRAVVHTAAAAAAAAADGGADDDHAWAACLSLFRFDAPAASVALPPAELARFVARCVLPLAGRLVVSYSACGAALELLREATDCVHEAEDSYVGALAHRSNGGGGGGGGAPYVELAADPKVYRELARARAELLVARARVMARAGEREVAEDHCRWAINILEVISGHLHPQTLAVRAFLEQDVLLVHQAMDGSEPIFV